jgi:hypothetical protein
MDTIIPTQAHASLLSSSARIHNYLLTYTATEKRQKSTYWHFVYKDCDHFDCVLDEAPEHVLPYLTTL